MKRYQIVSAINAEDLEEEVNELTMEGDWVPQGGVCFTEREEYETFHQAMIKEIK